MRHENIKLRPQVRLINAIYAAIEVADSVPILLIDYFALIYVLIKLLTLLGKGRGPQNH